MDNLYRPTAKYGSGSTADAVRHELRTGELLSKTGHITKAVEARDTLSNLMKSGELSSREAFMARWIRNDLHNSLNQQPWDKVYTNRQGMKW